MKITNIYKTTAALNFLMVAALWPAAEAWGQRYDNRYEDYTIKHKPAKWHDLRSNLNISQAAKDMDTFNDTIFWDQIEFPGMEKYQVQSAHTLIDTIYVHKGSSVRLSLPDRLNATTNMNSYQRWYSFRTDKTFEVNNPDYAGNIKDLLTPVSGTYYRFKNGYVVYSDQNNANKPYSMDFYFPTDEEFKSMFTGFETTRDNNWYLVACDVSGYDDFTEHFVVNSSNKSTFLSTAWEPTLTHRVIYYICAVENESNWYVKALKNQTTDEYLEDYVIHMPATRLPNKTNEMVALSKDARAYALPGKTVAQDDADLRVRLDANNNTARITLAAGNDSHTTNSESDGEFTLTGETRKIHFLYPNQNSDNTRSVNGNNTEATILVTKGEKNIARFKLVFSEADRLLTQSQVNELDQLTAPGEGWRSLTYRTPNKLNTNPSYELLTELNFDYDPNVAHLYGASQYYPFPMAWENSSYGFFDGGAADYISSRENDYTEWGNYSILNDYLECGTWAWGKAKNSPPPLVNSKGTNSTYHLFVDASDRPGVIARLPFHEDLCPGTELFVSAWVKSARYDADSDNAGMLFTIMGAEKDENGQEKLTPLYRYQTGQIPATYQNDRNINLPGFDTQNNEWFQVYFSFINSGNLSFDRYILQIDNNSASTQGGDMYLDDVRVYMATPSAEVTQLQATCTQELTRMNMKMDWRRLISRTGGVDITDGDNLGGIDFCFIDTLIYHNYKINHPEASDADAIKAAVVEVGDGTLGDNKFDIIRLYYHLDYEVNISYEEAKANKTEYPDGPLAKYTQDEQGRYYFYKEPDQLNEDGDGKLLVDFYSLLSPNRPYLLLIRQASQGSVSTYSDFADFNSDPCAIKTEFYVQSTHLVKMNGEIVDPNTRFCAGQIFNFSVQLSVPIVRDGVADTIYVNDGVYFDWFFGKTNDPETEFTQPQEGYNVSVEEALKAFRVHYPDLEMIDETVDTKTIDDVPVVGDAHIAFTEDMRRLLIDYFQEESSAGLHNRLILHKPSLDITLLKSGLRLVVSPIQTERPPREDIPGDQWSLICWKYIPLMLETSGESPQLHLGFDDMNYPKEGYEAALRIGLKQIERANSESSFLRVNLRGATFVSEDEKSFMSPIQNNIDGIDYLKLYLVGTNDPQYPQFANGEIESIRYDYPIGTLHDLYATRYEPGLFNNQMDISFDTNTTLDNGFKFDPREGYWYRFVVYYEERINDGTVGNACQNSMNVLMKVVPEYLVWGDQQKSADYSIIGNWNNDGNWKRADKGRLLKADNDSYPTNEKNETDNGFVPMHFSKVIMPENSKVELYAAGSSGRNWITHRPSHIAAPTDSIQYDLMAFDNTNGLTTERYRVSLLNQIHFEPGAEMLHAEYLLYDTAWVDYQLDKGRWYTLASPLKAVYAGDFYTDKSGTEGNEYFQPIYYSEEYNSRFNPSVYQRGWKGSNATMVGTPNGERAISGNWSALYNKVDEAYTPGTGFSLKVQDATGNVTFRLPKADGSYKYYPHGDGQSGDETPVSRVEGEEKVSGRLRSDTLYIRKTDLTDAQPGKPIEITLSEMTHGDYYLVGNPFIAHLNMSAFFDEDNGNGKVLQKKYWVVDNNSQTVAVGTEEDLTTTNPTGDVTVAPLQSFFVQKAEGVTGDITLTFTQDMQTLGGTNDGLRSANALTITATTTDGRTSRAAVAYDMAASADYEVSEDAELFLDSNLGDVPMVYTVAGTMATSINRTSELYNIPLGVYGNKQEMVTLSFGGLNQFSSATLYDAQEQTETPLREGKTVSVPAGTSGRYFLRAGTPTGNEVIARNAFLVYSVGSGKVMVTSSNTPLKDIRVYTMGGAQVRSIQASGMQQEIYLNRGIYLITVSDQDGLQETRKVLVR